MLHGILEALSWPFLPSVVRKIRHQQAAQLLSRPGKVRFGRCFWDAERLPNLAEAQLGVITEQHDRTVAPGPWLNRIKDMLSSLMQFDLLLWLPLTVGKAGNECIFTPIRGRMDASDAASGPSAPFNRRA